MPFTPFHMGPGIMVKGILQGGFSLMVFGWSQMVMDIQPLFVLITGEGHLHGFSHTFVGATLLAVFSALSGKYLSESGLKILGISKEPDLITIKWPVVCLSAFVGTYSHLVLDAVMHSDLRPYYPLSQKNELLGIISATQLHLFCVTTGLLGVLIYCFSGYIQKKRNKAG